MKKQIFDFIKRKTPNLLKVLSVVEYKDSEDYIVKCLLSVPDRSIPVENMVGEREQTCLINKSEFNRWLRCENSIMWI